MKRANKPKYKLLPCPFCGKRPSNQESSEWGEVEAEAEVYCDCPARPGVVSNTLYNAARLWNRRNGKAWKP